MQEIIERISGYDDKSMWDYCETLKKITHKTKEVKSGRGKAIEIREVLKYETNKEVLDRIIRSCEYYKDLYESQGKFKFRPYQVEIINKAYEIIRNYRFVYLAMEVRTGKTLTSLGIAKLCNVKNVLYASNQLRKPAPCNG